MSAAATERVGRYQLLEPIGVGPNGTVSRAKVFGVAGFERQFAIKRFHAELTSTAVLAQALSAAARAYGSLEHPRIARMSEFGVAQGTTFTAVEFVSGLDALRLIAEARMAGATLAPGGALALVSQAARAVGYAHGRGLTHLGLAPTNVMITAEGDIKITDFGILSAALPPRPLEVPRLLNRIPYLAPEQLANEATSAATDVFALGVLAYELVTGHRTFRGETPQQIAQSVMAGPPIEPPLPRPIVRVLQRCLARSPFERFPDARALADALDAALRVAPVPGTRKDVGAQVKQTMERIAALHEGEMSGVLALNIGTGPIQRIGDLPAGPPPPVAVGRSDDFATDEFRRLPPEPPPAPGVARAPGEPSATVPDLPRPPATVTGLPPMPVPVPQGVTPPPISPAPPAVGTSTLIGISSKLPGARPPAPPIPLPRPGTPVPGPVRPSSLTPAPGTEAISSTPAGAPDAPGAEPARSPLPDVPPPPGAAAAPGGGPDPSQRVTVDLSAPLEPSLGARAPAPAPRPGASASIEMVVEPLNPDLDAETELMVSHEPVVSHEPRERRPTMRGGPDEDEPSAASADPLFDPISATPPPSDLSLPRTSTLPLPAPPVGAPAAEAGVPPPPLAQLRPVLPDERLQIETTRPGGYGAPGPEGPGATGPRLPERAPSPPVQTPPAGAAYPAEPALGSPGAMTPPPGTYSPGPLAQGGYPSADGLAMPRRDSDLARPPLPPGTRPRSRLPLVLGGVVAAAALAVGGWFVYGAISDGDGDGGGGGTGTGPVAGGGGTGSSVAASRDAGPAIAIAPDAPPDTPPKPAELSIVSIPAGARVFLDGADAGTTPLKLPGSADRHTVALLLAGHELYLAEVDGHGTFSIPLKEVVPAGDFAGIKVLRCKDKERYYVYVDGKPSGQTCPTERINTTLGRHTVEVYDIVTETRRKWEIDIKDGRLSYRIRIDPP